MRLHDDFAAVRVLTTNANLSPGFDSMGLALDLQDEISVHVTTRATSIVAEGEGVGNAEQGEDNLIVCTLRLAFDRISAPQVGVRMYCTNRIPHSRGLGLPASTIVAGATLARILIGDAGVLDRRETLTIGSQMEGYLDSVTPTALGGATVSQMNDETSEVSSIRLTPPESISPIALIPDFELRTATAHVALLATVPYGDTSFNVARGALLTAVLSGNAQADGGANLYTFLTEATRDRLHQEQRRTTMGSSLALIDQLHGTGFAAIVFGAGPTALSLESVGADIRQDTVAAGWRAVPMGVAPQGTQITRGSLSKVEF